MQFSKYQKDIFEFVKNGKGNAVVNAVAGSGKTTTIVETLKFIPNDKRVIFLAFNKSIVDELSSRVPDNVQVYTLHSFGLRALRFRFKDKKVNVDQKKVYTYLKVISNQWNELDQLTAQESEGYTFRVRKLLSLTKLNLASTENEVLDIADKYGFDIRSNEAQRVVEVLNHLNKTPWIADFDDMVYQPAYRDDFQTLKYDYVFVDECQDLNKAQQALMKKIIKPITGRFIAVGDPQQAIYGFAGADAESYGRLRSTPNTTELPLSVSYRCGKNIIERAQAIVPQIQAFEGSIDGEVRTDGKVNEINGGDMVLCRNKAPLISLTLDFLARGTKAYMMGKNDIAVMLINLVNSTKATTIPELYSKMSDHVEKFVSRKLATSDMTEEQVRNSMGYENLMDKIDCIKAIIKDGSVSTTTGVIEKIERIFDESNRGIILSTIHKAKGLEADNIFVLKQELLPSKSATQPWQRTQERNLEYVMITRAKKSLIYLSQSRLSDSADENEVQKDF